MKKAKIFASWANFEREFVWKQKDQQLCSKQCWCLNSIIQLDTDYDLLQNENGSMKKNEEKTIKEEDIDILWKNRNLENRGMINNKVVWHEYKYVEEFPPWMITDDDIPFTFDFIQLVTSKDHKPRWNVQVKYGPTTVDEKNLNIFLHDTFDHYYRGGDVSFSIVSTRWKRY